MANLRVSELDFDDIKQNLKTFLSTYRDGNGDLVFSDYDFEGSGLSVLLDLLSYNTHYNAYLSNMLINEMFLDSSVKRSSAVSIAKHLGYTTRSVRGSRAIISFTVSNPTGSPTSLTLDRYTPFTTTINGSPRTFVNLETKNVQRVSDAYTFTDIQIVEGVPLEFVFRVRNPGLSEKYEIPNPDVDTSTMLVTVQNSNTDLTTDTFTLADDSLGLDGTSKVYFLEENPTGLYQIVFGDNILGKKLSPGNLIKVQYLISSGSSTNVSGLINQSFSSSALVGGGQITGVTASQNSAYGADKETITEIKFNAPKYRSSHNRAVNYNDYKVLIDSYNPGLIDSVAVWGGEDNIPRKYGKVMIALSPAQGLSITEKVQDEITEFLRNKRILSVNPEYVNPEYFYVNLDINVKYDYKTLSITSDDLKNQIIQTVETYFNTDLKKFDKDFIYSKLSKLIDNTNPSILGNLMSLKVQKRLKPILNTNNLLLGNNSIKFYIGIMPGSLSSTRFAYLNDSIVYSVVLNDLPNDSTPNYTGTGIVRLVDPTTLEIVNTNYGTINYGTGEIIIPALNIYGYYANSSDLKILVQPQNDFLDVAVNFNQIILLDDSTLDVNTGSSAGLTVSMVPINA